jgi:hypothetical protein
LGSFLSSSPRPLAAKNIAFPKLIGEIMSDPILFWNNAALEANRVDHTGPLRARNQRGPTLTSRALAMVHIAMHDAYFGFVPKGAPLNPEGFNPVLTSNQLNVAGVPTRDEIVMSVSQAAYTVLSELFPSQRDVFDRLLDGVLAGASSTGHNPLAVGRLVANNVLSVRANDGAYRSEEPTFSDIKGHHRPDPFTDQRGTLGNTYGETRHFVLDGHLRCSPPPGYAQGIPFNENDPTYLDHYKEVKGKGAKRDSSRTVDELITGIFWAYDGIEEIGAPPRLYNQIALSILANRRSNDEVSNLITHARVLMLINVAMADAAIEAWHFKFTYDLWRPVIGIRERGAGLGPQTTFSSAVDTLADPFWEPIGAPNSNSGGKDFTPPFPAYPSGHATFGAAVFEVLRLYYDIDPVEMDQISFDFVSDELNGRSKDVNGVVRSRRALKFSGLAEAMFENG